jgi:hypothetical protein
LFSRLSGHDDPRGKIGVVRVERSSTQRQKHREGKRENSKQPLAPFHGSTPLNLKHGHSAHLARAAQLPPNQQSSRPETVSTIHRQLTTEIGRVPPAEAGTVNVSSAQLSFAWHCSSSLKPNYAQTPAYKQLIKAQSFYRVIGPDGAFAFGFVDLCRKWQTRGSIRRAKPLEEHGFNHASMLKCSTNLSRGGASNK